MDSSSYLVRFGAESALVLLVADLFLKHAPKVKGLTTLVSERRFAPG